MSGLCAWTWFRSRFYRWLADVHRHMGNRYSNREEYWAAIEYYTRAAVVDPAYVQVYFSRGVLYWREVGNYYRAVQDLTKVLDLDPTWTLAYFNRGLAHKMRSEPGKALADFERYLAEGTDTFWLESAQRQVDELHTWTSNSPADGAQV